MSFDIDKEIWARVEPDDDDEDEEAEEYIRKQWKEYENE